MKYSEAMEIINEEKSPGYMVSFERIDGKLLISDHFPDKRNGEDLISTEDEAWSLAEKFAEKTKGYFVNIYVVDSKFQPVPDYENREITNRTEKADVGLGLGASAIRRDHGDLAGLRLTVKPKTETTIEYECSECKSKMLVDTEIHERLLAAQKEFDANGDNTNGDNTRRILRRPFVMCHCSGQMYRIN